MAFMRLGRLCIDALLSFFYPSSCMHCRDPINDHSLLFCPPCTSLIELIQPVERCPRCFGIDYNPKNESCLSCRKEPSLIYKQAAAFDYIGPPSSLIKRMKYAQQPYLAKGAAAFMVAQWANLEWPMPDIVVPVPMSFTHWLERGYNQSELLAKEIATLLDRPMVNALGRKSGDYSQAGLSISQRRSLEGSRFYLRSNQLLYDKTILLIDDVITSGTTLNRCAEALMEGHPGVVYGLSFCKA